MKVNESEIALPLQELINTVGDMNRDEWIYIDSKTMDLSEETICYRVQVDEFTDEEVDQYEEDGKKTFLNKDQIEDILSNLSYQKSETNLKEKIEAISYFWRNDAFIKI